MRRLSLTIAAVLLHAGAAQAAEREFTLRAADEPAPAMKEWERGASIAYVKLDDKSTTDIDAVGALNFVGSEKTPQWREFSSVSWRVGGGAYLHKYNASSTPEHDRGWLIQTGATWLPGNPSGPVLGFDTGLLYKRGTSLTATGAGTHVDVDTSRALLTGSAYFQNSGYYFLRATAGAYSDDISDAPTAGLNGRENGVLGKLQASFYPLKLAPTEISGTNLSFTPLITAIAQKQWDTSASGARQERDYKLYSIALSLNFARDNSGFVPSLDISRSIGADLLEGRARVGKTSVRFSLKY